MTDQQTPRVRARRPSAAAQALKGPSALDQGDWVEYGLTMEYRSRGGTFWPKVAVGTTVREGESAGDALARAVTFVTEGLEAQINEIKSK